MNLRHLSVFSLLLSASAFAKDYSEWQMPRTIRDRVPNFAYDQTPADAQCAVTRLVNYANGDDKATFHYAFGLKAGETIDLSTVKIQLHERRNKERGSELNRHTEVDETDIFHDFSSITSAGVASGCVLSLNEGDEMVVPASKSNAWTAAKKVSDITGPAGDKMRAQGRLQKLSCLCLEQTPDPLAYAGDEKSQEDRTHIAQLASQDALVESSKSDLTSNADKVKKDLAAFEAKYLALMPVLKASEVATDENTDVTLAQLTGYYNQLEPAYVDFCDGSQAAEKLEVLRKVNSTVTQRIKSNRVLFSSRAGALPDFWDKWRETIQILNASRNAVPSAEATISDNKARCDLWQQRIIAIVQRTRLEHTKAFLEDFKNLQEEVIAAMEAQTNALKRYNQKLYWAYLIQKKVDDLLTARASFNYSAAESAVAAMAVLAGNVQKYVDASPAFDAQQKIELKAELRGRLVQNRDAWLNAKPVLRDWLTTRVQKSLNNEALLTAKSKLRSMSEEDADLAYQNIRLQLSAASLKLLGSCKTFAESKSNKLCWTAVIPSDLGETGLKTADSGLENVYSYLNSLN